MDWVGFVDYPIALDNLLTPRYHYYYNDIFTESSCFIYACVSLDYLGTLVESVWYVWFCNLVMWEWANYPMWLNNWRIQSNTIQCGLDIQLSLDWIGLDEKTKNSIGMDRFSFLITKMGCKKKFLWSNLSNQSTH